MKTTMYKQGNGWVVSSWSNQYKAYTLSAEMPYSQARKIVGEENCPGARGEKCNCPSHDHTDYSKD